MTQSRAQGGRSFEMSIEIGAPPDVVWRAISDAEELARWFPPAARVTPGVGGSVWLSWGEGIEGETPITIWEPGKRLRLAQRRDQPWSPGEVEAGPVEIAVEYHLAAREGGGTVLRLVHSGFGRGAGWDHELDSISNGWKYELRSLKHYLERHRGVDRATFYERATASMPREDAWRRLTGRGGIPAVGSIEGLKSGERYRIRTAAGHEFEGTVLVNVPPRSFAGTVEGLDDGLLRLEVEPGGEMCQPFVWLSVWGPKRDRVAGIAADMRRALDGLFGEGAGKRPFYSVEQKGAGASEGSRR